MLLRYTHFLGSFFCGINFHCILFYIISVIAYNVKCSLFTHNILFCLYKIYVVLIWVNVAKYKDCINIRKYACFSACGKRKCLVDCTHKIEEQLLKDITSFLVGL